MEIGKLKESRSPARCAYCHGPVGLEPAVCAGCQTALHRDCFAALAACPTLGCGRPVVVPRKAGVWRRRAGAAFVFLLVVVVPLVVVSLSFVGRPIRSALFPPLDGSFDRRVDQDIVRQIQAAPAEPPREPVADTREAKVNPEYDSWSDCNVGSTVTLKADGNTGGSQSTTEMTTTLLERGTQRVVLETKMTVLVNGKPMEMPANRREVSAWIAPAAQGSGPSSGNLEGDEVMAIAGHTLLCHWTEAHADANGLKTVTRTWTNKWVPGRLCQLHTTFEGSVEGVYDMRVTSFEKK